MCRYPLGDRQKIIYGGGVYTLFKWNGPWPSIWLLTQYNSDHILLPAMWNKFDTTWIIYSCLPCGINSAIPFIFELMDSLIVHEINFTRNANYKDKKQALAPLQLVQFCPELINSLSQSSLVFRGHCLSQPGRTLTENSITLDGKMDLNDVLERWGE